ncbi:MAG: hypothetical protein KDD42_05980 [Bdellovibrionales bacterium]|nr:hypothetical protein [Bdellovibrionales bacterium]
MKRIASVLGILSACLFTATTAFAQLSDPDEINVVCSIPQIKVLAKALGEAAQVVMDEYCDGKCSNTKIKVKAKKPASLKGQSFPARLAEIVPYPELTEKPVLPQPAVGESPGDPDSGGESSEPHPLAGVEFTLPDNADSYIPEICTTEVEFVIKWSASSQTNEKFKGNDTVKLVVQGVPVKPLRN